MSVPLPPQGASGLRRGGAAAGSSAPSWMRLRRSNWRFLFFSVILDASTVTQFVANRFFFDASNIKHSAHVLTYMRYCAYKKHTM